MVELADIFRDAGSRYLERFGDRVLPSHRRVLRDIVRCRTPALGGQLYYCRKCEREHAVYHSCRNRHCPKCQGQVAEKWLKRNRQLLIPCSYGLATCTLPAGLRQLARSRQREVYSILIRAAGHALLDVAANPRFIGGQTGIMAVLHTWSRNLIYHPHVHMLFPVGGLVDSNTWRMPRKRRYIFPERALAKQFRQRCESAFRKTGLYDLVPKSVWCKPWVAHVKKVGNGEQALLYLSRYVFRVAISNRRILAYDGQRVSFSSISSKDGSRRIHNLPAEAFIRRFLQHVLPRHFVKVRYYGLWAPASRGRLALARNTLNHHLVALGKEIPAKIPEAAATPTPVPSCPFCGTPYQDPPREIPRSRAPP